jgi:hypothetical protein
MVYTNGRAAGAEPSDADGRYTIPALANGSYTLSAEKAGHVFKRSSLDPVLISFADASLDFTELTYSISGEITGLPADVPVTITDGVRTATSFRSGTRNIWSLQDVPSGNWHLRAFTATDSLTPVGFDGQVLVTGTITNLIFARSGPRRAVITGRITHRGDGLAGAALSLWRAGSLLRTTTADREGRYAFDGLTRSAYLIIVSSPGISFVAASQSITIDSGDVSGVNFTSTGANSAPSFIRASATQSPAANAIRLSAVGGDDSGEQMLRYSWEMLNGPPGATVVFERNHSNGAHDTLAVIDRPGTYLMRVEARDVDGAAAATTVLAVIETAVA